MKRFWIITILALTTLVAAGCSGGQTTSSTAGTAYTSKTLNTSYSNALSASDQLMLGSLRLEETEQAITAEQAAALLPLLQALQGGALASDAERNAVYAQIETQMTPAQLQAIAAMKLTQQDQTTWMESQAPGGAPGQGGPAPQGTPGAPPAGGSPPDGGTGSPDMATRRAQMDNMSEEQRTAMRATIEAGGMPGAPGGRSGAGGGQPGAAGGRPGAQQGSFLVNALVQLLSAKVNPGATS